ncbi:MAG: PQQ-dependent dehydrogenase, methanol/ethanol family [Erythrobacter sp.]
MKKIALALMGALCLASCGDMGSDGDEGRVTNAVLVGAESNNSEWLSYGRTYSEQRFSPLDGINAETVSDLGLTWFADMDTSRGQEATPLVIDGKIYVTTAWSKVKAYDGRDGTLLWEFDPEVPGEFGVKACCDVVNRGLATWGDNLFLGTLDGRLIALDRDSGSVVWETLTVDQSKSYTITGAPRVIDGKVLIGNGGAEFGVRGYIGAYDAADGSELWRFYTVPEGTEDEDSPEYLQTAADTWNREVLAGSDSIGGGGTVWDAMAYDPELDLLYFGVGNGSPWNQAYRSPGGGDNLYLSSIVAVKPDTGEYVWHYQTTPGETWDFTATQHIILADLEIEGEQRQVLMQAPKNGFFYVLDRATGELLSANNYIEINWADGVDLETGRPIERPEARFDKTGEPFAAMPGPLGGHNWHPMAFHPDEGLVYIPAMELGGLYIPEEDWGPDKSRGFNIGIDLSQTDLPPDSALKDSIRETLAGALIAWDPVKQEERWRVTHAGPWNGGLLATGGGLVFQGNSGSEFAAYSSSDGSKLWSFGAQTGIVAAPATYTIDGEQYIAVLAGWGGTWAIGADGELAEVNGPVRNISRLLVFKLGGTAELPEIPELFQAPLDPPPSRASEEVIASGKYNYGRYCFSCHGGSAVGTAVLPDLRRSGTIGNRETFFRIVHDGLLQANGMAGFAGSLDADEIEAIRAFVIHRANEDKERGIE